eukprot:g12248.t1
MRLHGVTFLAAAAAAIGGSTTAASAEDSSPDEALAVQAAESVGILCPAEAACELEMGVSYGDPWVIAEAGDLGYFEVHGTAQVQPSEVIVTLAYGDVKTFARCGGQEPSSSEFDWSGGRVLRLPGWSVPLAGDTLVVMVNATSEARYRVLAASDEDILRLEDGMPVQMVQDESEMRYFSVAVQNKTTDLLISLDAQSGDPDMYVSPKDPLGRFLPTSQNFTWQALSFGTDTLHMQGESLDEYCTPGTEENEVCTYNIGVAAKTNCSYTIKASLNNGWKNPQQLLLGQPQSSFLEEGSYDYYSLFITRAPDENPWQTLLVTVTPTDGGQQDLYATTNRTREPGQQDYDVKSTNWAGSSTMMFSETAPGFCTDCTIYVSVYGYKSGGYSLVASQGLTRLQEGLPQQGTVGGDNEQQYFEFFNPPGPAQPIQVVATALTGDPDLYVTVGGSDLPGPHNFHWMGGATGTDFVDILPKDDNFCVDCTYQIGLNSVGSSSFTVSVNRGDGGATLLVHGRPQAGKVVAGGMRYYVVRPDSDTTKMTVTLNTVVGNGDLYVVRGNATTTIDPLDDSSFSWTSKGLPGGTVSVEGAGSGESTDPYLIGVSGETDALFALVATFSQGVTLLQAGVPQRRTLEAGKSMTFGFLVDEDDEDLQLTVTPMRGDPALYAGMGDAPSCAAPGEDGGDAEGDEGGDAGAGGIVCSGWTWAVTTGRRRDIPVSSLHPCEMPQRQPHSRGSVDHDDAEDDDADDGSGPEDLGPRVNVSEKCAPSSFGVGMMFMTVAAQGGEDASFSVVASLLGKHTVLVPGVPQHAVTSPMIPCGSATKTPSGPCSSQYETSSVMQEAMFTFRVDAMTEASRTGFSLSLLPECNGPCSGGTCPIGCPDRPAKVYVKSCLEGECRPEDRFPSQGNADRQFEVTSARSSIFIADSPGSAGDGVFCFPSPQGQKGTCVFYIGVTAGGENDPPMELTATTDIPHGLAMVVPCVGDVTLPDGVIVSTKHRLPRTTVKLYEVCAKGGVDFQVSVESCRGEAELFAGATIAEQRDDWEYNSNGELICTNFLPPRGNGQKLCEPVPGGVPQKDVSLIVRASDAPGGAGADSGEEEEEAGAETYFVGVGMRLGQRVEDQEHVLRVNLIGEGGVPTAPVLSSKPLPSVSDGVASRAVVGDGEATVEWGGAILHTPKYSGQHAHEAEDRDCGFYCAFEVFAVPTRLRGDYPQTPCGLESAQRRHGLDVVYKFVGAATAAGEVSRTTVGGLRDEEHDVFVVAKCDFLCLEALLRMQCSRALGSIRSPCQPQTFVFPAALLVSSTSSLIPTSGGDSSSSSSSPGMHQSLMLLIAALLAVVGGVLFALVRQKPPGGGGAGGSSSYAPANATIGGGGWWRWLIGAGGLGTRHRGRGVELTDLQAGGRSQNNRPQGGGYRHGGGGGLDDEFFVGDGRGGRDAESGPGYASLLEGQDQ